ncbi:MAG: PAS domain-containing sensor histidine kinase [Actinomycetota bacterium]
MSLEEIISRIREAIVVLDKDRRVDAWLGGAERMFGWTPTEMIGRDLDEVLLPKDGAGNTTCIGQVAPSRRLAITKGTPERELLTRTKKGAQLWVGVTSSFERDGSGEVVRTIVVVRDVSRRKRVDLAKSEVISAVAHELRSPLTSVKGFTSTLLLRWDRFDDEAKKRLLTTINDDTDRVTRLIGELLDVSRLEAGRLQLARRMVKINDIASRVVERMRPRAEHHEIAYDFPEPFPEVFADSDKIEQVLTNLVENAMKYTDGGRIAVQGELEKSMVAVHVSDEGSGIALENRSQVFGKFFRDGAHVGNPGTGLGLYISRGLVEAHGGRIWVGDAAGGGAVFTFTLPIQAHQ